MPIKLDVEIKGLKQIQRKLSGNELYAEPFKDLMSAIGQRGENIAATSAPHGRTGQLEIKISHAVQKKPLPLWVAIRSRARRRSKKYPRGYPYGWLLERAPKYGHFGWFSQPLKRLAGQVGPLLNGAAREIERKWGSGQ